VKRSEQHIRERHRDRVAKEGGMTDKSMKEKGVIKALNSGGFGFIIAADGEKELFFHKSQMIKQGTFECLRERDEVLYRVGWNTRREKEMAVEIEIPANANASKAKTGGVIAALNSKGFGFIQPHSSEQRIYFHSTGLAAGERFELLREGDEVEYVERFDEKFGKPQAHNVQSCRNRRGGDGRDMFGYAGLNVPPERGLMPQRGQHSLPLVGDEFARDSPSQSMWDSSLPSNIGGFECGPTGVLMGRIESKTEKGFGFIEPLQGGETIYFHRSGMQRWEGWNEIDKGDKVSFVMGWDKKTGKNNAIGVRLLSKCTPDEACEGWFGKVTGRITSLNQKGFGFLTTGEKDMYFHSTSLFRVTMDDLNVGDDVVFTKGWDRKNNKEMAKMVELRYNNRSQDNIGSGENMGQEANVQPRSRIGHISRVNTKGFGFIKPEDSENSIYFHRTSLEDPERFSDLKEGNAVIFEDGWDRKNGKVMAINVQLQ